MLMDLSNDKSISVQVIAWCHQAVSHYFSPVLHHQMTPLSNNELTQNISMYVIKGIQYKNNLSNGRKWQLLVFRIIEVDKILLSN